MWSASRSRRLRRPRKHGYMPPVVEERNEEHTVYFSGGQILCTSSDSSVARKKESNDTRAEVVKINDGPGVHVLQDGRAGAGHRR